MNEEWQWLDDIGCIEFDGRYILVADINMTVRLRNCLTKSLGCKTLRDVIQYGPMDLLREPNFGRRSLDELISILKERGLKLSKETIWTNTNNGRHVEGK